MDPAQFDDLTRALFAISRRNAISAAVGGVGSLLGLTARRANAGKKKGKKKKKKKTPACAELCPEGCGFCIVFAGQPVACAHTFSYSCDSTPCASDADCPANRDCLLGIRDRPTNSPLSFCGSTTATCASINAQLC